MIYVYRMNYKEEKLLLNKFKKECEKRIEDILRQNKQKINIVIDNDLKSYIVRDIPNSDAEVKIDIKSNFLWFLQVKELPYLKDHTFFWLNSDGEIYSVPTKENSNLYIDELGFLITNVKDNYNEYERDWDFRVNCYYNDIIYNRLMVKRDEILLERQFKNCK